MEIRMEQAPEVVAVAAAEEADRLRPRSIDRVDAPEGFDVESVLVRVDEGPDEPPFVHEVDRLRRRIEEIAVALGLVVGRDHLDEGHHEIEGQQDEGRGHGDPVAAEFPPHQPP
jgi:hypothetical protein